MPSITQLSKGRSTTHLMHPDEILADPRHNGRFQAIPEPKDIIKGFLEVGQLEPIAIRPNPDKEGNPILAFGFRRWMAAKAINDKGLTGPAHSGNGPFLLECKILDSHAASDLEAFKRNILENSQRSGVNPMDDAHNLHRLVTDFGLSRSDAAAVYGKPASFASRRLALLTLAPDLQDKIAKGDLGIAAAEELAKAPEEAKEALETKIRSGERVVAEDVVAAGRDSKANTEVADADPAEGGGSSAAQAPSRKGAKKKAGRPKAAARSRTTKEVRVLLKSLMEDDEPGLATLGVLLGSWMDGKLTDNGLRRKLTPLLCKES